MSRTASTWSPDTARAMAARSAAVRAERRAERLKHPAALPLPPATAAALDPWPADLLAQVRARAERISSRLDEVLQAKVIDGQQVNWLAGALERVADLERVLAGRPLPGSHRPAAGRPGPAPRPALEPIPDLDPDPGRPEPDPAAQVPHSTLPLPEPDQTP